MIRAALAGRSQGSTRCRQYLKPVTTWPATWSLVRRTQATVASVSDSTPSQEGRGDAHRNPLGVQLLCPAFSNQVFPPGASRTPPLHPLAISLSQNHLHNHGLSPSQASVLPSTNFSLPPLKGADLGEHFWNIGRSSAQPWLSLSEDLAAASLLPPPSSQEADSQDESHPTPSQWVQMDEHLRAMMEPRHPRWQRVAGWVKYPVLRSNDGKAAALGEGHPVDYPDPEDSALVFDVETMVQESPFPVMATAAGPNAWYAWLSPWLLGESDRKDHLIPFGDSVQGSPRLVVGHNVGYDRARIRDEYSLSLSKTRFVDTQSLHIAVRGISSPQRPAWIQHRKNRAKKHAEKLLLDEELREEQRQEVLKLLGGEKLNEHEVDELVSMGLDLDAFGESTAPLRAPSIDNDDDLSEDSDSHPRQSLQWQDISSTNSLAEVAALHCGIHVAKDLRNHFVDGTSRQGILEELDSLLSYCARDVSVTHAVFAKVLPAFRETCPHPATFAGVLGLGSPILPIDDEWVEYQQRCDAKYEDALKGVRQALMTLAEELREEHKARAEKEPEWWKADPWLSQLDWSPKKPKKPKPGCDGNEDVPTVPKWYRDYYLGQRAPSTAQKATPFVLMLSLNGESIQQNEDGKWVAGEQQLSAMPTSKAFLASAAGKLVTSNLGDEGDAVLQAVRAKAGKEEVSEKLRQAAEALLARSQQDEAISRRLTGLDWSPVSPPEESDLDPSQPVETWPRWYWDLYKSATGQLELTIRTRIAPLLLKVSWRQCPLYHSREHGWVYLHRPLEQESFITRQKPLVFEHEADAALQEMAGVFDSPCVFYKVPHTAGEEANVGSPFSKSFMNFFDDGTLRSEHPEERGQRAARDALALNAQCSYWIGVRDRVANQMVVWDGEGGSQMDFDQGASGMRQGEREAARRKGLILPQVVTMGTITRRAIEKTWLTASNAKKNRVGSELKSMVKAPPGWAIVGADVDSEELWICSVMGDAQFGVHGATAIGWMTLEGTKSAGTDLHSKTASILGTSRNQAKVFNYSRIYGAGIRHATQLLLKANPAMPSEEATRLAKELYASTKGTNTHSPEYFGRKFWFGGTESFVFNKLEDIALSEHPRTPALDCGITAALSRKFLPKSQGFNGRHGGNGNGNGDGGGDFMPSRINWVVQSSGVDYLHLLITSMDHLCRTYDIAARFMLSVHDEVRYLAREEDAYRAALALQIANLWTRAMFAFKLEMEGLPEGVAWFAQVDLDKVLRKEVDDPCITPSQTEAVPEGEALDIHQILEKTKGGSLHRDGRPNEVEAVSAEERGPEVLHPPYQPSDQKHRSLGDRGILYLQAQASDDIHEIRALERRANKSASTSSSTSAPRARRSSTSTASKGSSSRSPRSSSPRSGAGVSSSPSAVTERRRATGSASFSTSATASCPVSTSYSFAHASVDDLLSIMPRTVRPPPAFYTRPEHKQEVRWTLYRSLLRDLPRQVAPAAGKKEGDDDAAMVQEWIRDRFKKGQKVKRPKAAAMALVKEAHELLALCSNDADIPDRQERLTALLSRIRLECQEAHAARQAIAKRKAAAAAAAAAARPVRPRSHPSGSLLAPSFFNVPLLRYKPQPVRISMTIKARRERRAKRQEAMRELGEEAAMLLHEDEVMRQLRESGENGSGSGSGRGRSKVKTDRSGLWAEPVKQRQRTMFEAWKREEARSQMVFGREMLARAKEARRRRIVWHTERKKKEREKAAKVGEEEA